MTNRHTQDTPSRNEDEYFAKRDAELIKEMRSKLDKERDDAERKAHYMKCPKCGARPQGRGARPGEGGRLSELQGNVARRRRDGSAAQGAAEYGGKNLVPGHPRLLPEPRSVAQVTAVPRPGDPKVTPALVAEHGLTEDEYAPCRRDARARADVHRAGDRQRALERALRLQALAAPAQDAAHQGAVGASGTRRECGRHLDRRRHRRRVQDRVAQPSIRGRAVPGRRDRRGRNPARRLHHGRTSHRAARFAALRVARLAARALPLRGCRERHRRLRQLRRCPDRRRRSRFRRGLRGQSARQRDVHRRRCARTS